VPPRRLVFLLRGVNLGSTRRVPMADLRALAVDAGLRDPITYKASGNLIATSSTSPIDARAQLERSLAARFGFDVDVVVREGDRLAQYLQALPATMMDANPNLLMLALASRAPPPDALATLRARARGHEQVAQVDDALWIDYGDAVRASAIAPGTLDRAFGTPVTTRNLRTVQALAELAREPANGPASDAVNGDASG
jgi:uncharacterized protein (DUF1697 family)